MDKFNGWTAYMSDGTTLLETPPITGKPSAWQTLLHKCRNEEISIKRLSLIIREVQIMSLPIKQCRGFFQAKEIRKEFFGSMGNRGSTEELSQGIGCVIGDHVYIQWINLTLKEHVQAYITSDVRPLYSCIIHTTLN